MKNDVQCFIPIFEGKRETIIQLFELSIILVPMIKGMQLVTESNYPDITQEELKTHFIVSAIFYSSIFYVSLF